MSSQHFTSNPQIHYQETEDGGKRFNVMIGEQSVSQVEIIPLTIRIGLATVRVDGIIEVETNPEFRIRGFIRRLMNAAIAHMQQGDACLSVLHGIANFYHKFGYVVLGPMYHLNPDLAPSISLPPGWIARPFKINDLPAIQQLYEQQTQHIVGTIVRPPHARIWSKLTQVLNTGSEDECRVIEDEQQQIVAYAWRGKGLNYVTLFEGYDPEALILGEVIANSPRSADAILAICRQWGREEALRCSTATGKVYMSLPPGMHVVTAALYQKSWFRTQGFTNEGPMVRLLDEKRLLSSLKPELWHRFQQAHCSFAGIISFDTESGSTHLSITQQGMEIGKSTLNGPSTTLHISLPQSVLARLAMGGFPPDDLLARSVPSLTPQAREILTVLFPQRAPHFFMADRP